MVLKKRGFDPKVYLEAQKEEIKGRLKFYDRLYLEFGGKLCYDMHASRVLPGYKKTTKVKLLKSFDDLEIIYCVNAKDLESKRVLGDFGLSYYEQVLKDMKDINSFGLKVNWVVITMYSGENNAFRLKRELSKKGIKTIFNFYDENYRKGPREVIQGFKKQHYVHAKSKIVVVTGVSGNSGKMATALNQIYHDRKNKIKAGFSKFETFPVWNLALRHPVNIAYEAATADIADKIMFDPFHKKAYGIKAVNYNRDIDNFEILKKVMTLIHSGGKFRFKSPTDMGVNRIKEGIIDDRVCRKAAIKEIYRRQEFYFKEFQEGREEKKTLERMNSILKKIS